MTEAAFLFGAGESMLGIMSRPSRDEHPGYALLMFNSGVLSRIGPHRLNVKLARALAEHGVSSFRFDLSGHGDSRTANGGADRAASPAGDIIAAMDHLQQRFGIERCALLGICSGAADALPVAVADSRVVGLMMFDGHWYRSRWTLPMRHLRRLRSLSPAEIVAKIRHRARRVLENSGKATPDIFDAGQQLSNPPRQEFARSLQVLVDRRVVVHLVFTATVLDFYSYANQFRHLFGSEGFFREVRCDLRLDIDHTFASLETQDRAVHLIGAWAETAASRSDAVRNRPGADSRERSA